MRTLIYKRTHVGDPDASGQFGIHDCMGSVRSWDFDAVIGVGGISSEPESCGIAGKVTWIGIGPHKRLGFKRGPIVTFDHFVLYDSKGRIFSELAPHLADRMLYLNNVRKVILDSRDDAEVRTILNLATNAPPSLANRPNKRMALDRCVLKTACRKSNKIETQEQVRRRC